MRCLPLAPLQNGMINFEKRRKEFEILVKVSLFQKSAANYSFTVDHRLEDWIYHFHVYSEQEGCVCVCVCVRVCVRARVCNGCCAVFKGMT